MVTLTCISHDHHGRENGTHNGISPSSARGDDWQLDFPPNIPTNRLFTLMITSLGIFYYVRNRREMAEVMHEAEDEDTTL